MEVDTAPDKMSDGPRYDDDFYAWTQYQAKVLRSLPTSDNRFDREHVAEEIEDLGKSERNAMRSEVRRILEHFLKLAYSPLAVPQSDWMVSTANARAELEDRLTGLLRCGEADAASILPTECPYTLEQIVAEDWFPSGPRGQTD